jgi:GDPmannose 4,6-dehydratase
MAWNDKNVLITGINGFVGSYLSKKLIEKGANVSGLVRNSLDINSNLIKGDLLNKESLKNALNDSYDIIFHLAGQSFVPKSFENPEETYNINGMGTLNLLDSIISNDINPKIVFAGSSDEYGLVFSSQQQYISSKEKHGNIFPAPVSIPELPVTELNPLRPMSPYGVSKVFADFLMRNYHDSYGFDTVISRSFIHEGAGRGLEFVSSVITDQVVKYQEGIIDRIKIGNVNSFRDWSHVNDIVDGYILLAEKGLGGEVYNQGSMRTNSILTFILLSLESIGLKIDKIETPNTNKIVKYPTEENNSKFFGVKFNKTKLDQLMLSNEIEFTLKDKYINVFSGSKIIKIEFDSSRFRQSDVPILLASNNKIRKLGFKVNNNLNNIINDQIEHFRKSFTKTDDEFINNGIKKKIK